MSKFSEKLKEELKALLAPAIFFFVALHVIAFVRALMLEGTGIALSTSVSVTIGALIIAKAVLIADLLPVINRFPDKPLVYNIAWKTFIYLLVATLVHYLERVIEFWGDAGGFVPANKKMLAEVVWPHFLAVEILLLGLILVFCTMREIIRVIGKDEMKKIFFGPLDEAGTQE